MAFSCGDELEDFKGVGVLCACCCDAEVVAQGKSDFVGFEAELTVDVDAKSGVVLFDHDA